MKATQVRTLDAGRRIQGFLDTHAATIGTVVSASLRAKLDDAVTQFAAFQLAQSNADGTAKGEMANQTVLRRDLFERFLVPVARTAKAALRGTPEFPNLVVPAVALRKKTFLATMNSFAQAVAKHEKVFIDHSMPADFLTQLQAALVQTTASAMARDRNLELRVNATAGCIASDKLIRTDVGLLDGVLKPLLKHNPALAAEWKASKRIKALIVTPAPGGTVVVPAPSPAAPPVTPVPPKAAP